MKGDCCGFGQKARVGACPGAERDTPRENRFGIVGQSDLDNGPMKFQSWRKSHKLMPFIRWILPLLALFLVGVSVAPAAMSASAPPNIILVITDDQGYGDLGAHGNSMIRTPNLDRLHQDSVRLTQFHVDPSCSPTRAALLTGRYSTRTGVWHTVMGRSLLHPDEITVADVLAENGYRNGIFGKWHLGDNYPLRPQDRGFHDVVIHGGGGVGQTPDFWGNNYFDDHYLANGVWTLFDGYCTDVFFDQAIQFIEENRHQPFFVYLPTNVPHWPYHAPSDLAGAYREQGVPEPMASFYGMIENFDQNMGRLMSRLHEWNLHDNTILIFMSDNGTAAGVARPTPPPSPNTIDETRPLTEPWIGFNAGMRGQKGSPYDGGHRVPCFIHWPAGGIKGGRDITQLSAHIDLFPTLLELAGIPQTAVVQEQKALAPTTSGAKSRMRKSPNHSSVQVANPLDGRSLVPMLRERPERLPERTLFVHVQREDIPPKWRNSAVLTDRWRFVHGRELFEIQVDPGQTTDVAAKHPDVVNRLTAAYVQWWDSLVPAFQRDVHIVIGSPHEPLTALTAMDWRADISRIPWDQTLIRAMPIANGYWKIKVDQPGRYQFTLRHQPASANFPLQATIAQIQVGSVTRQIPIPSGATAAQLNVELEAGPARLQTWLTHEPDFLTRGAFFVDIQRLDP
jgi:arylsulfatase A-like enzyme